MTNKLQVRALIIIVRMLAGVIALLLEKDTVSSEKLDTLARSTAEWLDEAEEYAEALER